MIDEKRLAEIRALVGTAPYTGEMREHFPAEAAAHDLLAMLDAVRSCSLATGTSIAGPCGACLDCVTRSRESVRLLAEAEKRRAEDAERVRIASDDVGAEVWPAADGSVVSSQ